tara:strand:- start:51 stop:245 length:195 start_codon:yes stop_codon:yes gene_type:complete
MLSGKKLTGVLGVAIITGIGINYHYCGTHRKTFPYFKKEDGVQYCPYKTLTKPSTNSKIDDSGK